MQGQLAARYGLRGEVNEEQFARLSEGQHPATGEALIRRQQAREYVNDKGETARTVRLAAFSLLPAAFLPAAFPLAAFLLAAFGVEEFGEAAHGKLKAANRTRGKLKAESRTARFTP